MQHISNKKGKCAHFFKERALDAKQIINFFLHKNQIQMVRYEKHHGHRNQSLNQSDSVNYLWGRIKLGLKLLISFALLFTIGFL